MTILNKMKFIIVAATTLALVALAGANPMPMEHNAAALAAQHAGGQFGHGGHPAHGGRQGGHQGAQDQGQGYGKAESSNTFYIGVPPSGGSESNDLNGYQDSQGTHAAAAQAAAHAQGQNHQVYTN